MCSQRAVFLHFLQRKLLNSLYLMLNWTTGTETPAPSFPRGRERQAQSVRPPQAPREGQGGPWPPSVQELVHCSRAPLPTSPLPAAPAAPPPQAVSQPHHRGGDHSPAGSREDRSHQLPPRGFDKFLKVSQKKFASTSRSIFWLCFKKMPPALLTARVPVGVQKGRTVAWQRVLTQAGLAPGTLTGR